ncbi:MAG: response regulator [Acidimicrobiia bacterium]|nr:response regulator [Acidimicrobiia bacterium]MBT8215941.1 response regulator [Acidimicrobiia bacterium]NNF10056.1 response regulator [Acidimicrobiia bacterium]NNL68497.1 response regulator [Acidimicrobiia bacterium]
MSRHTILVIEDSPVVQHLFLATFKALDVDVVVAGDGLSGIEAAHVHQPDIITLDIGLPDVDGWEVLTRLRASEVTAGISVLVVTAHAQPTVAAAAEESGVDGFMTKPFRPADLRDLVQQLLGRVPAELAAAV